MYTTLPAGHPLRAPTAGDADAVAVLLRARDVVDLGRRRDDGRGRARRMGAGVDLAQDAWVVRGRPRRPAPPTACCTATTCWSPSIPRRPDAGWGPSCGERPSAARTARGVRVAATVRADVQHRRAHRPARGGMVARPSLLPHADRSSRRLHPRPMCSFGAFDRSATPRRCGICPGRLHRRRGPPTAVAGGMAGDAACEKPGWDPEPVAPAPRRRRHRRRGAGGARRDRRRAHGRDRARSPWRTARGAWATGDARRCCCSAAFRAQAAARRRGRRARSRPRPRRACSSRRA